MSLALLDTHAWVWLMNGSEQLGPKARKAIQRSLGDEAVLVSAISAWEVAMLASKGRLVLDRDVGEWIHAALAVPGLRLEPISHEVAVASTRLPGLLHADPADRLIMATARHCRATLVTADQVLIGYGKAGHIRTLHAGL